MIDVRKTRPRLVGGMVIIACALLLPVAPLAGGKSDPAPASERMSALNFVKMLNSAERSFLHAH